MWASVRLRKQRRAFVTEIMSTMTVLVKSIKSTCRVKYPTEKDRTRGANLNLQVTRESWGRVDLGGHPPRPPTDPDVRVKRIWLFIS
jgi:hypothetical protein